MLWILISVVIVGIDQVSKYFITKNIQVGSSQPVIDGFFYIAHVENKGAAFGILQNMTPVFVVLTFMIMAAILYFIYYSRHWIYSLALSFILGGALGNLIDRIFRQGTVVDFFDFTIFGFPFWVFNVADVFVVIGTTLLAIYLLFLYDSKKIFSQYKL